MPAATKSALSPKRVHQFMLDADRYPLALRLAARLYLDGVTSEEYRTTCTPPEGGGAEPVSYRISIGVLNHLLGIESGRRQIEPRLRALAEAL